MTARYFLGESRSCVGVFRFCVTCFWSHSVSRSHFRSEVSCGSAVASAASWASLGGGEPCGTLTQDTFLSRDELVFVSFRSTSLRRESATGVCQLRHRWRRCSEASLVELSHNTHFLVAMSSLFLMPQSPRGRLWK